MKEETLRMSDIEHVLKVLDINDDGKDIVTNKVKKMVHFCILPNLKKSLMDKGMVLGFPAVTRKLALSGTMQLCASWLIDFSRKTYIMRKS